MAGLLGKDECGTASERDRLLLRALTPISKLYSARVCLSGVSEVVEVFGGAGYIEETGIPRLLRDAQVFSIWEGTTNILSLDFLRALDSENARADFIAALDEKFAKSLSRTASANWLEAKSILSKMKSAPRDETEAKARTLSLLIADVVTEALDVLA